MRLAVLFLWCGLWGGGTRAEGCTVFRSSGVPIDARQEPLNDPLFALLQLNEACPKNVMELRALMESEGAVFRTTMVGNQGFHHPEEGSFSFFEMVEIAHPVRLGRKVKSDELFFGHFTRPGPNQTLTLDQRPNSNSLMIELISENAEAGVYHFYELIGSPNGPRWNFRGSSEAIWADLKKLHLKRRPNETAFGGNLRCSGCHLSGGPIMKEHKAPHDSWWFKDRPLPLAGRQPDALVQKVMQSLRDPGELAAAVSSGLSRLAQGKAYKKFMDSSPQLALRPLFCPLELNLESSPLPLENLERELVVPVAAFIDKRLGADEDLKVLKADYEAALVSLRSSFGGTPRKDADHAWMAPVKAVWDQLAIEAVGQIDRETLADILAVDPFRPMFSPDRCALVNELPEAWSEDWLARFKTKLNASALPAAKELLKNLTEPERTAEFHLRNAQQFLKRCREKLQSKNDALKLLQYLGQVRAEARASEISQNPRGEILEPGFRVVFADFTPAPTPWRTRLDGECNVVQ